MCRWWIQSFSSVTEEPQRWKGTSVLFASHVPLACAQVLNVKNSNQVPTLLLPLMNNRVHSSWTSNFPWGYWHWQTGSWTQLCGLDNSWDATRLLRLVTGMHNAQTDLLAQDKRHPTDPTREKWETASLTCPWQLLQNSTHPHELPQSNLFLFKRIFLVLPLSTFLWRFQPYILWGAKICCNWEKKSARSCEMHARSASA